MEFRQIRYALAVAKERSFTRASAKLNISQSAVSEQVKLLEEQLGFNLFVRTGRGIEPTERGRLFLYEAERVASELLNLRDMARRLNGIGGESLIMGITSGVAQILLPRMFSDRNFPPSLHLEVKTAPTRQIFDELHEDKLDLGIAADVGSDRVPSGLVALPLIEIEMQLIFLPGHRFADSKKPVAIHQLRDEPIIMNELSVGYGQLVSTILNDITTQPRIRAIVDNVETIKVMVQSGAGIAIIPGGAAALEEKSGLLKSRPIASSPTLKISAYRSRRMLLRKQALLDQILKPIIDLRSAPKTPSRRSN